MDFAARSDPRSAQNPTYEDRPGLSVCPSVNVAWLITSTDRFSHQVLVEASLFQMLTYFLFPTQILHHLFRSLARRGRQVAEMFVDGQVATRGTV